MRALVVTLKFNAITPETDATIETIARSLAACEGLLSTYWLRATDRFVLVQSFESRGAVSAYLDNEDFAALGRAPGVRDIFVTHYEVATKLNALSVLGVVDDLAQPEQDLVLA